MAGNLAEGLLLFGFFMMLKLQQKDHSQAFEKPVRYN